MSAENSRLTRAIQRIAREDPGLRRAIDATKSRGDQAGGLGVGESDGERDRICCDGTTSYNPNPGTDTRDPDANAKDGLDPDDPADISDNLAGVVDCETGQPICFEGSDWIPPDGWEDAQSPQIDPTYIEGSYWSYTINSEPGISKACGPARSKVIAYLSACEYELSEGTGLTACPVEGFGVGFGSQRELCRGGGASIVMRSCEDEPHPICDAPPPLDEEWPADGCANLAIKGGSIVGSKYDPENDGSYSAPRDEIELCDPETGDSILIRPSSGGGWKSIRSLQGEPDGAVDYGYLYARDGKLIRQISPSEFRDDTV